VKAVFLFIALIWPKAILINCLQGLQPEKCPLSLEDGNIVGGLFGEALAMGK
jgi:hypothetical protein